MILRNEGKVIYQDTKEGEIYILLQQKILMIKNRETANLMHLLTPVSGIQTFKYESTGFRRIQATQLQGL